MSPALTNAPNDAVCRSCETRLDGRGLKCTKCSLFTHVRCSELPDYQLVRYAVTSIQYCCIKCCKSDAGEDAYNDEIKEIHELKDKEKQIVKETSDDAGSFQEVGDAAKQERKIPPPEDESVKIKDNKSSVVCRYYLLKSCKEGLKGEKCHNQHPKI